ncbi:MAG: metallopeptidase family protein [Candidatus Nealsonbacteria bacterium]
MNQDEFEKLVSKALLILPKKIRQKMENIAICVEKRPSEEQLRKTGLRHGGFLLGLYEGIPQTVWGKGFGGNLPDKITIFQESIENFATRPKEIKELIKNVVWHEIAHHFGFSERGIKLLEQKRGT